MAVERVSPPRNLAATTTGPHSAPQQRVDWAADTGNWMRGRSARTRVTAQAVTSPLAAGLAPPHERAFSAAEADRVIGESYRRLIESYFGDLDMTQVAIDALTHVAAVDPNVRLERTGLALVLRRGDTELGRLPLPSPMEPDTSEPFSDTPYDEPRRFRMDLAQMTKSALDAMRAGSPAVAALPPDALYAAFFDGVKPHLDPISRYAGPQEAEADRAQSSGTSRTGLVVGVNISVIDGKPTIVRVVPGSSAAEQGLRPDDELLAINGVRLTNEDDDAISELMRRHRPRATVTVRTPEGVERVVELQHRELDVSSFDVEIDERENVATIRLTMFDELTADRMRTTLAELRARPVPLRGIMIDLQHNPGGNLHETLEVGDQYIDADRALISVKSSNGLGQFVPSAHPGDDAGGVPVVVFTNGASASASELLSSALADFRRAVIVGSRTYGKWTVNTNFDLANGGQLILTTQRYAGASGRHHQGVGLTPHVCTVDAPGLTAESLVSRALEGGAVACAQSERQPRMNREVALYLFSHPELYTRLASRPPPL